MWPVKQAILCVCCRSRNRAVSVTDTVRLGVTVSVTVSVTAPTHSLSPSVVRIRAGNSDFTLQCVKHSYHSLVR